MPFDLIPECNGTLVADLLKLRKHLQLYAETSRQYLPTLASQFAPRPSDQFEIKYTIDAQMLVTATNLSSMNMETHDAWLSKSLEMLQSIAQVLGAIADDLSNSLTYGPLGISRSQEDLKCLSKVKA